MSDLSDRIKRIFEFDEKAAELASNDCTVTYCQFVPGAAWESLRNERLVVALTRCAEAVDFYRNGGGTGVGGLAALAHALLINTVELMEKERGLGPAKI